MRRSIAAAARGAPMIGRRWSSSSASSLPIPHRATRRWPPPSASSNSSAVRWSARVTALEPYLLQLRLEMGAANA